MPRRAARRFRAALPALALLAALSAAAGPAAGHGHALESGTGGRAPTESTPPAACGTAAAPPCRPCNRTIRIGAPRLASPAVLGIMGKSLDFVDACFAFYDEPSGGVALDWVEAGFLDMAVVC